MSYKVNFTNKQKYLLEIGYLMLILGFIVAWNAYESHSERTTWAWAIILFSSGFTIVHSIYVSALNSVRINYKLLYGALRALGKNSLVDNKKLYHEINKGGLPSVDLRVADDILNFDPDSAHILVKKDHPL